jgi:hypothetical protein
MKNKKWKRIITYLNSKTGKRGNSLAYIVHENDVPQLHIMYTTLPEQLVNCAILHGNEYNTNNGMVYDVLQSLKLNGPAWTWINAYQVSNDGRNAWKTLLNFYEGDSAKTRSKLYFHCN